MADVRWRAVKGLAVAGRGDDLTWSGTVDDGVVKRVLEIPGSDDAVVLLDPETRPQGILRWHPFPNVMRIGTDGDVCWHAELIPNETAWKCWIDVGWDGDVLRAFTASYWSQLDPSTGRIIETTFVK